MTAHAVQRLAERYEEERPAAEGLVGMLKSAVLAGEAKFIRPLPPPKDRPGPPISEWRVYLRGRWFVFRWCEQTQAVVTVVPSKRRGRARGGEA